MLLLISRWIRCWLILVRSDWWSCWWRTNLRAGWSTCCFLFDLQFVSFEWLLLWFIASDTTRSGSSIATMGRIGRIGDLVIAPQGLVNPTNPALSRGQFMHFTLEPDPIISSAQLSGSCCGAATGHASAIWGVGSRGGASTRSTRRNSSTRASRHQSQPATAAAKWNCIFMAAGNASGICKAMGCARRVGTLQNKQVHSEIAEPARLAVTIGTF